MDPLLSIGPFALLALVFGIGLILRARREDGRRRRRFTYGGTFLTAVSGVVLVLLACLFIGSVDWYQYSSTDSLLTDAANRDERAYDFLCRRLRDGKLNGEEIQQSAAVALAVYRDSQASWASGLLT